MAAKISSVLVIGAGGVGGPAIEHLVSSGVKILGIAEFDRVERSNLPRQLFYHEEDIGRPKLEVLDERIRAMPGSATIIHRLHDTIVRGDEDWIDEYDIIIEAIDGEEEKLSLHDHLVRRRKTLVHAAATGWRGQGLTLRGPGCLRCLFGVATAAAGLDCRRHGILGPVAGRVGLEAAEEALRLLRGERGRWENRFWTLDALARRERFIAVSPDPDCPVCSS